MKSRALLDVGSLAIQAEQWQMHGERQHWPNISALTGSQHCRAAKGSHTFLIGPIPRTK